MKYFEKLKKNDVQMTIVLSLKHCHVHYARVNYQCNFDFPKVVLLAVISKNKIILVMETGL